MGIRSDHHAAGEGVVFQDDLVDDAGAGLPEADAVARRGGGQEFIHLRIGPQGVRQVLLRAAAGADQVVAMHGGGHAHGLAARAHELQQRHLGGCILHRHAVRPELAEILQRRQLAQGAAVIEMGIQDLLGKSKRPPQRFPRGGDPLLISSVKGFDYLRIEHKGKNTTN